MNWFWVMTVQWDKLGFGTVTAQTVEGTMTAEQASRVKTRASAFKSALAVVRQHLGIVPGEPVTVLFWSLEPDLLGGADW